MSRKPPVIASKPIAKTITSSSYSASAVRIPRGVIPSIGERRMSTRWTFPRLKTS